MQQRVAQLWTDFKFLITTLLQYIDCHALYTYRFFAQQGCVKNDYDTSKRWLHDCIQNSVVPINNNVKYNRQHACIYIASFYIAFDSFQFYSGLLIVSNRCRFSIEFKRMELSSWGYACMYIIIALSACISATACMYSIIRPTNLHVRAFVLKQHCETACTLYENGFFFFFYFRADWMKL